MIVTVWERYNEDEDIWTINHFEDGVSSGASPTPRSKEQEKSWRSGKWRKRTTLCYDHKIISIGKLSEIAVLRFRDTILFKAIYMLYTAKHVAKEKAMDAICDLILSLSLDGNSMIPEFINREIARKKNIDTWKR